MKSNFGKSFLEKKAIYTYNSFVKIFKVIVLFEYQVTCSVVVCDFRITFFVISSFFGENCFF